MEKKLQVANRRRFGSRKDDTYGVVLAHLLQNVKYEINEPIKRNWTKELARDPPRD
jgi:hypothetical protein